MRKRPFSIATSRLPAAKVSTNTTFFGVLADVDEAAGTREPWPEFADVKGALLVRLGKAKKRQIEPAAIAEVELIRLIDNGLRVCRSAEVESSRRHAADDSWLRR